MSVLLNKIGYFADWAKAYLMRWIYKAQNIDMEIEVRMQNNHPSAV